MEAEDLLLLRYLLAQIKHDHVFDFLWLFATELNFAVFLD